MYFHSKFTGWWVRVISQTIVNPLAGLEVVLTIVVRTSSSKGNSITCRTSSSRGNSITRTMKRKGNISQSMTSSVPLQRLANSTCEYRVH